MLSRSKVRFALVLACTMACAALVADAWSQQGQAESPATPPGQAPATQPASPMGEMCKMHMDMMSKLKDTLAQAKQDVLAGKSEQATAKIDQAQQLIERQHAAMHEKMQGRMARMMGSQGGMKCPMCGKMMDSSDNKVSNSNCPMDGSKIDPSKMTKGATRDYKGEKLGFCCAGCADQWDSLSDAQKNEKMDTMAAKSPSEPGQGVGQR